MKMAGGIPYLTAEEMRGIDDAAIHEHGIDILSLMENAGAGTAELARRMLGGKVAGKRVTCLVGKGNNGGDGLVAARHIHNWGAKVSIALGAAGGDFRDIPAKQLSVVEKMGLQIGEGATDLTGTDLVIDALLGYNSKGDPRGIVAELIRHANASRVPILGLDIPSGLDPTTGSPNEPCIVADSTLTLGFPKTGFLNPASRRFVGKLYLCDISLPREVYSRYQQKMGTFEKDRVVRIQPRE